MEAGGNPFQRQQSPTTPAAVARTKSLAATKRTLGRLRMDSVIPPETDKGNIDPFKYPFDFAHKKVSEAGWARQVTIKDLEMAKDLAGVNMRLQPNGCRELHWHESGRMGLHARRKGTRHLHRLRGQSFVDDIGPGDLWYFPSGIPHSIQAPDDKDGCEFLLVFDDGKFSEYETFLISEWVARVPKDLLAKNFNVDVKRARSRICRRVSSSSSSRTRSNRLWKRNVSRRAANRAIRP